MDTVAISDLWKLGPIVSLLIVAVLWFAYRDRRNETVSATRHRACEKRNDDLAKRIDDLQDHLVGRYADLAERSIAELAASTAARRRALGDTVTPPAPLPTLHILHPTDHLTPRTST